MPTYFDNVKKWLAEITEFGLLLVALAIVLQILFGTPLPFFKVDIIGNLTGLIAQLGDNGLVGLIALAIIIWLFWKRSPG